MSFAAVVPVVGSLAVGGRFVARNLDLVADSVRATMRGVSTGVARIPTQVRRGFDSLAGFTRTEIDNFRGSLRRRGGVTDAAAGTTTPLFSQTTASPTFRHGPFSGQSVGDVADGLRVGKVNPAELPVDVIVRNAETIGLNTRSMLALRRGGVDPSDWVVNDVTGVPAMERLLTERLIRNKLTGGIDVL